MGIKGVETSSQRFFLVVTLILLSLAFAGLISGCSNDSGDSAQPTPSPTPTPDFDTLLSLVLDTYYPPELVQRFQTDAQPITTYYSGLNVFSTSQYGKEFIVGTVDLKDVFDARIPANYEIFKKWAKDNLLILNEPETLTYYRYALAATMFLREFEYDAVLFHPDEFQPVLTKRGDTWMFIREDPDGDPHGSTPSGSTFYFSGRFDNRHPVIRGGIQMEALKNNELWLFYIPTAGQEYEPFSMMDTEIVHGSKSPELLNEYTPPTASEEMIEIRHIMGITPSALSNKKGLLVGGWKSEATIQSQWDVGFSFSGATDRYTWGGCGFYVLPIDEEFWK